MPERRLCVVIRWAANPMRADRFAEHWRPAAEAALRYGAHGWSLFRALDGLHEFIQIAYFDSKLDFERYWYSEEISEARAEASGLFQVPLLPAFFEVLGTGERSPGVPGGPGGAGGGDAAAGGSFAGA